MKKRWLFALVLCLALAVCPVLAELYVQPGVFSVESPEGWPIGDTLLLNETAPCVSVELNYFPEHAEFNLFSADAVAFQDYVNRLLSRYADQRAQYLSAIYSADSNIPFVLIQATDASGPFFYAETMARGWAIGLRCYAYQDVSFSTYRPLTDVEQQLFAQMLMTFTPVR